MEPIVERRLAELLVQEIDFHIRLEQMKRELASVPGYNARRVFKAIDDRNRKAVSEQELRRFFKKVGHMPLKGELIAIMRRFDLDGDSCISFQEFYEAVTPI